MLFLVKSLFLLIAIIPYLLFAVSGELVFDDKLSAGKEFFIDIKVSYKHSQPIALRGSPELKLPKQFSVNRVSSFSKSQSGSQNVYYRYYVSCDRIGEYSIGPAIVTYYTKADKSKSDDKNLSLAEITKKAIEGEKEYDVHTFLINEEKIRISKTNYLFRAIFFLLIFGLVLAFIFVIRKVVLKRKTVNSKIDESASYEAIIIDVKKIKNEGDISKIYEKICEVSEKYSYHKIAALKEKKEQIKFAGMLPVQNEIENDIRELEIFLKNIGKTKK